MITHTLSRRLALRQLGAAGFAACLSPALLRGAGEPTPAPVSLAGEQPGYYRFKIGAIEALALNDGAFTMPPAESPFGIGEPREAITAALAGSLVSTDKLHLPFNVLLLRLGAELVLIDVGCGPAFGAAGGRLLNRLAAAGVSPEQVSGILITHMHGDHFGGLLDADGTVVFQNARVFMHRTEHAYWTTHGDKNTALYLDAFKNRWQLIAGGEKLVEGLEIFEAFGHTPGHIGLSVTSGSERLVHFVDVVHHHVLSFAHPEWVMKFDTDSTQAETTRRKVLDQCASDRVRVFGAHMPFPALGRVRRSGSAFSYQIEEWIAS